MDDSCAVCAETLEWVAYGPCGHRDVCSTCVVRLRFILGDHRCCICKTECPAVFVTKALGDYTEAKSDFSEFPGGVSEGQHGQYWYHEDSQAYFNDVDHYRMIRAMCKLSCSICDTSADDQRRDGSNRRNKFRNIEQLKGHLFHQHKMFMCSLCLEGRKVFISEQKLYTRSQLRQHISTGDSEVDGTESERGGFAGHPICEFCRNPFYGDTELYMHMSTEHYTCHICQRQHPGQYDYYRNYDDLEVHFRQEHFLCENETCLAKKFVVFQTEAEMKRHNAIEHGGNMSRSKRNAALQIPVSFRYRQSNGQDQRRGGRGRGFHPESSNNQLAMALHASLETAVIEGRSHESSLSSRNSERRETTQPDTILNSVESLAISSHPDELPSRSAGANSQSSGSGLVVEEISFPPLSNFELPDSSHRYAQALNQRSSTRLGEASFPPLPGAKDSIKSKAAPVSEGSSANTIAARLNLKNKGSVKVLHSARPKQFQNYEFGSSISGSSSEMRPSTQSHGPVVSASKSMPWGTTNQVAPLTSSASPQALAIRADGLAATVPINSQWNSNYMSRMRHSASAPNLSIIGPSNNPSSRMASSVTSSQEIRPSSETSQHLENVNTANKTLVESIRAGLGMDEEKYAAFKTISAEYRQDQINTWEYLSYVEQFGLSHLVRELARLCPDPHKQKELIDAYNANLHGKGLQESSSNAVSTKKDRKKGKGKSKAVELSETSAIKDALADSILDQVRKLQTSRHPFEGEVEALTKDGYRTAKDKVPLSANGPNNSGLVIADDSNSERESITSKNSGGGDGSKKNRKTSKFNRIRLGDGSVGAFLDRQRHADMSPERTGGEHSTNQPDDLPARGVWRSGGGQRLFSLSGTSK